jgi:hypothetical protein
MGAIVTLLAVALVAWWYHRRAIRNEKPLIINPRLFGYRPAENDCAMPLLANGHDVLEDDDPYINP